MSRLYWRCVWANKVTLAGHCLFGIVCVMEVVRQNFCPGYLVEIFAPMEVSIVFVAFMLSLLTSFGNDTSRQYRRTMGILQTGRRATISKYASYCYRVGHELALRDYAKR